MRRRLEARIGLRIVDGGIWHISKTILGRRRSRVRRLEWDQI